MMSEFRKHICLRIRRFMKKLLSTCFVLFEIYMHYTFQENFSQILRISIDFMILFFDHSALDQVFNVQDYQI